MVLLICCVRMNECFCSGRKRPFIDIEFWVMVWVGVFFLLCTCKEICSWPFQHIISKVLSTHNRLYIYPFFYPFNFYTCIQDSLCLIGMIDQWWVSLKVIEIIGCLEGLTNTCNNVFHFIHYLFL